jgi:hypothetical protein
MSSYRPQNHTQGQFICCDTIPVVRNAIRVANIEIQIVLGGIRLGGVSDWVRRALATTSMKNAQDLLRDSKIDTKRGALARNFDIQIAWFSLDM